MHVTFSNGGRPANLSSLGKRSSLSFFSPVARLRISRSSLFRRFAFRFFVLANQSTKVAIRLTCGRGQESQHLGWDGWKISCLVALVRLTQAHTHLLCNIALCISSIFQRTHGVRPDMREVKEAVRLHDISPCAAKGHCTQGTTCNELSGRRSVWSPPSAFGAQRSSPIDEGALQPCPRT